MTVNQNVAVLKYMNFSIQTTRSNHHWNGRYADIPISHTEHLDTKLHVHKHIITITCRFVFVIMHPVFTK